LDYWVSDQSVVTTTAPADTPPDGFADEFAAALAQHRCWPNTVAGPTPLLAAPNGPGAGIAVAVF
jgi:hypothetical protein